ncbi:hypothetical protein ABPG77_000635 [Micractinium sp. CCAP 211/92]
MDMATRQKLAALIQRDIDQLREKAEGQGVTAWLGRPVQRERPNEQFLQRTLRSVQAHNQRAQEEEMWERYLQRQQREEERQRRGQQRGRGSSSPSRGRRGTGERSPDRSASPSRSGSPRRRNGERPRRRQGSIRERSSSSSSSRGSGGAEGGLATRRKRRRSHSPARSDQAWRTAERDGQGEQASGPMAAAGAHDDSLGGHVSDDIAAMIASKRSRGRGGSGARAEMPGPYLPAGEAASWEPENEDTELVRRQQLGPDLPDWLQRQRQQEQEKEERELLAMALALQRGGKGRKERRKGKRRRRSGSEDSSRDGSSRDSDEDSDSARVSQRRQQRKEKRKKKEKKRKKKRRD